VTERSVKTLSTYVRNNDKWSFKSPCSSFAAGAWNSVASRDYKVSAVSLFLSTPKNLARSIEENPFLQKTYGAPVPYDYPVHAAPPRGGGGGGGGGW